MQFQHHLEYAAMQLLLALVRVLPTSAVYGLLEGLSKLGFVALKKRQRITLQNLRVAFPEKSEQERKAIARNAYKNLAHSIAFNLLLQTNRISNEELQSAVSVENWEQFPDSPEQKQTGTLFITAHLGNWELLPQFTALHQPTPIHVIARETSNPLIEEKLVSPLRSRFGFNVFYKKNAVLHMVKALKRGEHVGILIDQKLNHRMHVSVPFFDEPARTTPVPAMLQLRYNIPVQPVCMIQQSRGRFKFIVGEPIEPIAASLSEEQQITALTARHQLAIESMIRDYPDQWFWMHNRWNLQELT
jgi:KDO2-lipid IV(A) lauroyltransferase